MKKLIILFVLIASVGFAQQKGTIIERIRALEADTNFFNAGAVRDSLNVLADSINTVVLKVDTVKTGLKYHVSQKTLKNLVIGGYEKYIQPIYNGRIDSLTYQSADSSFNFSLFVSDNPDGSDSTAVFTTSLTATQTRQSQSVFADSAFTKYQFIFIKINSVAGVSKERGFISLYTKETD